MVRKPPTKKVKKVKKVVRRKPSPKGRATKPKPTATKPSEPRGRRPAEKKPITIESFSDAFWKLMDEIGATIIKSPNDIRRSTEHVLRGLPDIVAYRRHMYSNPSAKRSDLPIIVNTKKFTIAAIDNEEFRRSRSLAMYSKHDLQWLTAHATGGDPTMSDEEFNCHIESFANQVAASTAREVLSFLAEKNNKSTTKEYVRLAKTMTDNGSLIRRLGECLAARARYNQWADQENQETAPETFLEAFQGLFASK